MHSCSLLIHNWIHLKRLHIRQTNSTFIMYFLNLKQSLCTAQFHVSYDSIRVQSILSEQQIIATSGHPLSFWRFAVLQISFYGRFGWHLETLLPLENPRRFNLIFLIKLIRIWPHLKMHKHCPEHCFRVCHCMFMRSVDVKTIITTFMRPELRCMSKTMRIVVYCKHFSLNFQFWIHSWLYVAISNYLGKWSPLSSFTGLCNRSRNQVTTIITITKDKCKITNTSTRTAGLMMAAIAFV